MPNISMKIRTPTVANARHFNIFFSIVIAESVKFAESCKWYLKANFANATQKHQNSFIVYLFAIATNFHRESTKNHKARNRIVGVEFLLFRFIVVACVNNVGVILVF